MRATTANRGPRDRSAPDRCIALAGKGVPGSSVLEEAIEAVRRAARALHERTRRRGHEWKPADPEVRLRTPAGARGAPGFTVLVRVPAFVTEREAHEAAEEAARRLPVSKNIRLSPLDTERRPAARPGRDRLPGTIRRTRAGPQHRARELR